MNRKLAKDSVMNGKRGREKTLSTLIRNEKNLNKERLKSEAKRQAISRLRLKLPDDHTPKSTNTIGVRSRAASL